MAKNEKPADKLNLYRAHCVGISPILLNPMTDATLDELLGGKGARRAVQTDISVKDRAEAKLCLGPNNEFGFPANYMFATLKAAGRSVPLAGRKNISTATSTMLPALLTILPDVVNEAGDGFIPFLDQDVEWHADKRRGRIPATGVAVAIVRPKFPNWAFEVTVEVDEEQVNVQKVMDLFTVAGRQCGVGDFRPGTGGPFGRFKLESFTAVAREAVRNAA